MNQQLVTQPPRGKPFIYLSDTPGVWDGVTDSYTAFVAAANYAASLGRGLWIDRPVAIGSTWVPPTNLVLRSDFSTANEIKLIGGATVDGIEITSAIDIDGIVINANRSAGSAVRSSLTVSAVGCPFGAHGSMVTSAATYLSGVRLGRVKVYNTQARAAMCFTNVQNLQFQLLQVSDSWGAAVLFGGGFLDCEGQLIDSYDVGNFYVEGARQGQACAVFAESDSTKKPANWYTISAQATPNLNVKAGSGLYIAGVRTYQNTDTAVYVHDYDPSGGAGPGSGVSGAGTGIENVHFDWIEGDLVGKDLLKVRHNAGKVSAGRVVGRRCGSRLIAIENYAYDVEVGHYDGDQFVYDVIGAITGTPAPYTGGTGAQQTLSKNAIGVSVLDNALRVTLGDSSSVVRNVNALYDGSHGNGVELYDSTDVKITGRTETTAGCSVRCSNLNRFDIDITFLNALRSNVSQPYAIYLANDGTGEVRNGRLRWNGWETSGSAVMGYALRVNNAASNIQISGYGLAADFIRVSFGNVMAIIGSSTVNVTHEPIAKVSKASAITTDASGLISIAHGLYQAPVLRSARVAGSSGTRVEYVSADSTNVNFKLWTTAGVAVVSLGATIIWNAEVSNSNGV